MSINTQIDLTQYSTIPLNGKQPIDKDWQRFCQEKCIASTGDDRRGDNIGIATGPASGLLVLDIDDMDLFEATRNEKGWDLPQTRTVRTGGGGLHYYYRYPNNGNTYGNRASKSGGFDIRGMGGVVAAPGSIHPDTQRPYLVEDDRTEVDAPDWLLELAAKKKTHQDQNQGKDDEVIEVDLNTLNLIPSIKDLIVNGTTTGERSEAIMKVLTSLVSINLSDRQIMAIFEEHQIGEKYREKGDLRQGWLKPQIQKAREYVSPKGIGSKEIFKALNDSEVGDARLYVDLHRGKFCHDHSIGQWYKWNGSYWELDMTHEFMPALDKVTDLYAQEAERQNWRRFGAADRADKAEEKKASRNFQDLMTRKQRLQKLIRRKNVLTLAASGGPESLGITGEEWDKDPWLLGCSNGVINLKSGDFRPSKYTDYIKTISPTSWKGLDAPAPVFEKFLMDIFQGDSDLIGYMQRLLGYALMGRSTEHVLPILWGQGRNGKGTLLETLRHVLGPIASPIPAETLLNQKNGQSGASHTADLMLLRGKRMVWASETDEGRSFGIAKVKWLVGGDTITARPPYGKHFIDFTPSHTMFLLTNSKPHASADDYAFWKRVHLIPFVLSFVSNPSNKNERKADTDLPEKLKKETSGILAWLVRGCLNWQEKGGLCPPDVVTEATKEYREGEDIIGRFTSDCCELTPEVKVKSADLYHSYRDWCKDNGHMPLSSTKFGKRMGERFEKKKSNGIHYIGIRLCTAFDPCHDDF